MKMQKKYVDVILPLPVEGTFTYSLPFGEHVNIGQRVIVQFGIRKLYTAIVINIHHEAPLNYKAKDILHVMDENNIINIIQLKFWKWISEYYMSRIGDVMNIAIPSSLKLASESKVVFHPNFDGDTTDLNSVESNIVMNLSLKEELSLREVTDVAVKSSVFKIINELIRKEVLQIKEELNEKFRSKKLLFAQISEGDIDIFFEKLKSAKKQKELLRFILDIQKKYPKKKFTVSEILSKSRISRSILNALVHKKILKLSYHEISRLLIENKKITETKILSEVQKKALLEVKKSFNQKDVCLLHGVTSSGKTEIYIKLIEEQLNNGKQILYLVPEIALTSQIINRLREHFGNKVGISHSRMNNNERVEIWNAVNEKNKNKVQYSIILGARSSLFLPFDNLGLIIVDEEHEPSFKQYQPSPRYHARDAAIYLAYLHQAKVLLGSATPSIESYYNAKIGKYAFVELNSRFSDIQLPEILTVDIKKDYLKKKMQYHFSPFLIKNIQSTLDQGKQIILFKNRRGYTPILECSVCSWTPTCTSCNVSLTYHKDKNQLRCHYCGYSKEKVNKCNSCNNDNMLDKGFGTQQIEEQLKILFPDAKTKRMDYDSTRKKQGYSSIISDFERGVIDILIGTQMVTKGLDFDNVSLVGVLNADTMLKFPNFRALERAYQLMSQVAGRSGRKGTRGKVIIQTYDQNHEIINQVKHHDYKSMYNKQLNERRIFKYPPFCRLISINIQHKNQNKLEVLSIKLATSLRKSFGNRVLGPESPNINRIRNFYHKNILLKIEDGTSIKNAKQILIEYINRYKEVKDFKSARINLDIDPL